MSIRCAFSVLAVASLATSAFAGEVRFPEVSYSSYVNTLVGRQGSVGGPAPFGEGPVNSPVSALGGSFGTSLHSGVGPVPPGEIVSLPGTTAVADASNSTLVNVSPAPGVTNVHITINNSVSVVGMDGGSYLAVAGGGFSVTFEVTQTTNYTLTGTLAMDTEDVLAFLQMIGQPIFITPGGNGPINISGTLAPGTYVLRGNTESNAPTFPVNFGGESDGSSIDLTLSLSATLVGIGCDSIDFNNDTSFFDPQDIDAFLSVYSEGPCVPATATCNDIDFNNDGSLFDPCDIDDFLSVFSEGPCGTCGG